MFNSILVVCVGNICRSPIGERLLNDRFPGKEITSAGLKAVIGQKADPLAFKIAEARGLSLKNHTARQLTLEMCQRNDLILVMENWQLTRICKSAPYLHGKVMLYGIWQNRCEIKDPYKKGIDVFEQAFNFLEASADSWVKVLNH